MNPIFNECLKFLRDTSGESLQDLQEGYFWLDRQIIKGFDKQGKIHKFYKINISDSLELSIEKPKSGYKDVSEIDLASWDDLIEMNKPHLEKIESEAKKLIYEKLDKFDGYTPIVPISTGKDSMVVCYLVRECKEDTTTSTRNTVKYYILLFNILIETLFWTHH